MIGKLRRNLRERGARGTAERILLRLREGYTREELLVCLKTLDSIVEPKSPGKLRVEELERRHLVGIDELNRRRGEPKATRYFENCVDYGFHGFVALDGDDVVGYYWWVDRDNPTPHPDMWWLGRDFELEPGDVYGASFYLFEEYRGGGAAWDVLFQIESALRDRGYRRLWGYVEKDNRPARWTYRLRGYQPIWEMINRRFVFFRWRKITPVR
jgi:GNAT superfamily N-acetyltransferase